MTAMPHLSRSSLLVVDVQQRLLPAMAADEQHGLVKQVTNLIVATNTLGGHVVVSEQYPAGLGPTVAEIAEHLGDAARIEKNTFSVMRAPSVQAAGLALSDDVIVCGIEAHVCVLETGLDLLRAGRRVWVPFDAVASRQPTYKANGLEILRRAGAAVVNAESLIWHAVESAKSPHFKAMSRRIR